MPPHECPHSTGRTRPNAAIEILDVVHEEVPSGSRRRAGPAAPPKVGRHHPEFGLELARDRFDRLEVDAGAVEKYEIVAVAAAISVGQPHAVAGGDLAVGRHRDTVGLLADPTLRRV